jgi:hypothetical protein
MTEIKSFTNMAKQEDVQFEIDGDTFTAVGVAPAMAVLDISAVNEAVGGDKLKIVFTFLDQVLADESAALFAERLSSKDRPITIEQATSIAVWLMEEVYAPERPTQAQSPSLNGSEGTGQSSTDGAQSEGSTPAPSSQRVL